MKCGGYWKVKYFFLLLEILLPKLFIGETLSLCVESNTTTLLYFITIYLGWGGGGSSQKVQLPDYCPILLRAPFSPNTQQIFSEYQSSFWPLFHRYPLPIL
uniref:Uncharacterized protein n=1 Tax=Canis lupus dingo TaxID=286419 RepID=A0A8C0KQL8_CANLU